MNRDEDEQLIPYRLDDDIYLIGSFETGVTVYSQQVRALNLAHLLLRSIGDEPKKIGVIGGGIAGLTFASALFSRSKHTSVTVLERRSDLCPLQQGNDTRWLHPHIYAWPRPGSRNPSAALPLMNWREGRASDVANHLLQEWGGIYDGRRLQAYVDAKHVRLNCGTRELEWVGARLSAGGQPADRKEGLRHEFDIIVLAVGFGEETGADDYPVVSYWRNETYSQPRLDDKFQRFLISGSGDGALIDLFRLRIERFRQDRVVEELFGFDEKFDEKLFNKLGHTTPGAVFDSLTELERDGSLTKAISNLKARLRKDTDVILHLKERPDVPKNIALAFQGKSSTLNKILLYLLYRVGGFTPTFENLEDAIARYGLNTTNVICRHGTLINKRFEDLLEDYERVEFSLRDLRRAPRQDVKILWRAGDWD